jgi:4-hydroxybenzoate polyprenyltransferase
VGFWGLAFWLLRQDWVVLVALVPAAYQLARQVMTLDPADPDNALERFRSNRWLGALVAAACFVAGNA